MNTKKTKIFSRLGFLLLFFITTSSVWSQHNGFNYKAIIKDNLGNVVANQSVVVRFQILDDNTALYAETHSTTTDANGQVILTIGFGSPIFGNFSIINWATINHRLNVQVDIGTGLVDMGTSAFQSVPYANNVTGLETINEGKGIGRRLVGKDPLKYGDIGFNAIDVSFSNLDSDTKGATGNSSFATNSNTTASGAKSFAAGGGTTASGDTSFAAGVTTIASGARSTAFGSVTTASGITSSAFGNETKAESVNSFALGMFNIGGGNPQSLIGTDPLFEIGNGTNDTNRSNALTVLKNGTITAPSFDISEITDDKALITKEYAEANLASTGLEAIDEANGIGWRLIGRDPNNYGNIAGNAIDLSVSNTTSETYGATGLNSIAFGIESEASGGISTAMGANTIASGFLSTAMGISTTAYSFAETAIGSYSTSYVPIETNSFDASDRLFVIGNGENPSNRSNALTVYKSGVVNINDAYSLPPFDGSGGQTLITDGNGEVRWQTISIAPGTLIDVTTFGTNYGPLAGNVYEEPRYYLENNRVYIEGTVQKSSGTPTAGDVLFTLPSGFRPVKQRIFTGTQDGNNTVRVDVTTTGNVVVLSNSPVTFISLDGISFRID